MNEDILLMNVCLYLRSIAFRNRLETRTIMTLRPFFLCIILLIGIEQNQAQPFSFKRINVKDGLSQSSVLDIAKDKQGFMWFATRYGLNRYDGVRFKVYENQPSDTTSLCNNYINQLYYDANDRLWVGSQGGLDVYEQDRDSFKHFYFYQKGKKIHGISVLKIRQDSSGNIWTGTNRGLFFLAKGSSRCVKLQSTTGELYTDLIHELYIDSRNNLWATSNRGITKLKFQNNTLTSLSIPPVFLSVKGPIKSIVEDQGQNLWLGSATHGLYRVDLQENQIRHFTSPVKQRLLHPSIRELMLDGDQRLFIATQDGVSILDLKTFSFTSIHNNPEDPTSLSQNSVYALYEDDQHSLWVGTYFGGVNLAYGVDTKFKQLHVNSAHKIPHNVIRPIAEDQQQNLWFGTEGGGVFSTDRELKNVRGYYNDEPGVLQSRANFVKSIFVDRADSVWVGASGGGVYHLDPKTGKYTLASIPGDMDILRGADILSMYQDRDGHYWFFGEGFNKTLSRQGYTFEDVTPKHIEMAFASQKAISIQESSDKKLWILTATSLFQYDPASGKLTRMLAQREPPVHAYNCLLEDHRGRLWIGVDYEGLMLIDAQADSVLRRYTDKDGLASNNVAGLLEDAQGSLWITTTRGLSRLTSDRKRIQNYTSQDGIAYDEFNYNSTFLSSEGKVLLGSLGGLTWFSPASVQVNDKQPEVIFTGLRLFGGQPASPASHSKILSTNITQRPHLTFANSQRVFTIQFALDNYIKPAQNRFMYRLEGKNATWSTLDEAEVSFSNLASGSYVLAVKGANSDGIWSQENKISFTVDPPVYLCWWALLIYAFILCSLVFFVLRYFFLREIFVKEEQLHQTKLNFFSMISHEIRSHLSLIIIPIDNALEKVEDSYIRTQLDNASKNSKRLLRLSSELIDFRKAETVVRPLCLSKMDITPFITNIMECFQQVYGAQGITLRYSSDFTTCLAEFDPLQLEKVLFNLLSNAMKHRKDGTEIEIQSTVDNGHLMLHVSNQGIEIPSGYLEKIFDHFFQVNPSDGSMGFGLGLALSKQIMVMHAGDIYAKSASGRTTFTIVLPLKQRESVPVSASKLRCAADASLVPPVQRATDRIAKNINPDKSPVILIIEDNADLRAMIQDLLSSYYATLMACNGAQGLDIAKEHLPDLIITDVMMPFKNGIEVCSELKTDVATSHIPIILLTARSEEGDVLEGLAHHADCYLTKPFSKQVLLLQIRNLLRASRLQQQKYRQQYILEPTGKVIDNTDERFLCQLVAVIEKGIESSQYGVDFLASEVGMSSSVLYKKVKSLTGMTVNDFSKSIRLKKAAQMLTHANNTVSHVASYVGFMDSKYFSREFKKQFGSSPSRYAPANSDL